MIAPKFQGQVHTSLILFTCSKHVSHCPTFIEYGFFPVITPLAVSPRGTLYRECIRRTRLSPAVHFGVKQTLIPTLARGPVSSFPWDLTPPERGIFVLWEDIDR